MNESTKIKMQFKPQAAVIFTDELALLESILPDLIHAMMLPAEEEHEPDRRSPSQLHSA